MIISGESEKWVEMDSGLILPESSARKLCPPRPTAGDLFAGCGGLSLGTIQAGFRVVFAVEWDCTAVLTYMANLCRWGHVQVHFIEPSDGERMEKELSRGRKKGESMADHLLRENNFAGSGWIKNQPDSTPGVEHIIVGDVRKLTGEQILAWIGMQRGELDLLGGGPPCQGFSTGGKQNIADPRNNLVFEFGRLVCELHPRTIIMEEVPAIVDMVTPDGVPVLDQLAWILERGDYAGHQALQRAFQHQTGFKLGRQKMRAKHGADETKDEDPETEPSDQYELALPCQP